MSDEQPSRATIKLSPGFKFDEAKFDLKPGSSTPAPPLGVLDNFKGTFAGPGFNTIFRPNSTASPPGSVSEPLQSPLSHNVLELNLTTETLDFSSALGSVPNRGLGSQSDIFLNGVPYVQTVNDVTNPATGQADGTPIAIHFEPGLWMNVPPTSTNPVLANSLARMGSIPHGTTINAQGLSPTDSVNTAPDISPVDITPFVAGSNPPQPISFPSQKVADTGTPRLPQDLTKFIAAGTITQEILDNPNIVLTNANNGRTITKTITFSVSTTPAAPELGGGTANIAFLQGTTPSPGPNANATTMKATFWVETVQHQIVVPAFKPGQAPLRIPAPTRFAGDPIPVPVFCVNPPYEITSPTTITVSSIQIQYTQTVFLTFAGLTWPHVSVATLVPTADQQVPPDAFK